MPVNNEYVIDRWSNAVGRFFTSARIQEFRNNIRYYYSVKAGRQWKVDEAEQREADQKPVTVINRIAPIVRQVSGNQIIKERINLEYVPRMDFDSGFRVETDIIDDAVDVVEDVSGFETADADSDEDALTCGLGATYTYFDYTIKGKPWGEPRVERIFPGYLLYDHTVRKGDLNRKSRYAGVVEVVSSEWLDKYVERTVGKNKLTDMGTHNGYAGRTEFLDYFNEDDFEDIDLLYFFEFYEDEDVYDVENPFKPFQELLSNPQTQEQADIAVAFYDATGFLAEEINLDLGASLLSVNRSGYGKIRDVLTFVYSLFDAEAPKLKYNKRFAKFYYRAEIARGHVLKVKPNWSQSGFSVNFKTGYYDEIKNIYYGIVHDMIPVQENLNRVVSDYMEYLDSVPKGGMYAEIDALPDKEMFEASRAQSKRVTLLNKGAISQGKMQQKEIPAAPTGLTDFLNIMATMLPQTIGLNQEYLGMMTSGRTDNALYGRLFKQGSAAMANFFQSKKSYLRRQGQLFVDAIKVWADNNDGQVLTRINPKADQDTIFRLSRKNMATDYDIKVVERKMTDEERQETFNKLVELDARAANLDLMPIALEYAPIEEDQKERIQSAMTPPPPPEPNPLDVAMLEANIRLTNAQADEATADAETKRINSLIKAKEAELADEKADAEVKEIESSAILNMAKAGKEMQADYVV